MSENGHVTPERLDALLGGAPAETAAERDLLALAASLKEAAPRAGDDLRARVRALPEPPPRGTGLRRLLGSGRRGRALVAAPALAALAAGIVAVGVLRDTGGSSPEAGGGGARAPASSAQSQGGSAPVAPKAGTAAEAARDTAPALAAPPVSTVRIPAGSLADRLGRATRLIAAAEGTVRATRRSADGRTATLTVAVPPDRAAATLAAIGRLGPSRRIASPGTDGTAVIVLAETP